MVLQLKSTANCSTGDYDNEFNLADKFKFLSLCATEFKHSVPSSLLHEMTTYGKLTIQIPAAFITLNFIFVDPRRCHCIL